MATDALAQINALKKQQLEAEGQLQSNQFVMDMKNSTLFQFNWGELLSATPTALSLMGSCWIAASVPIADSIKMTKSVPVGGFKYIPNRVDPTLRSILVDVCNNGGKDAFTLASRNMDGLRVRSHSACNERIVAIFALLPKATKGPDQLQDFNDALSDFATDARQAAQLATETREAFSLWGKMVGELHAATEHQQGQTSVERDETKVAENVAKIEQKFAVDAADISKENVGNVKDQLKKAEKRLDTALDKVPGPWESVIQGAVTGFTQALPNLIAGALPMVIAASNPLAGVAMAAGGAGAAAAKGTNGAATNGTATNGTNGSASPDATSVQKGLEVAQQASDPAYYAAGELRDLVNHFYEFLGGEKGTINWEKFEEPEGDAPATTDSPSGTAFLSATLNGRKSQIDATETAPNKKLRDTIDILLGVVDEVAAGIKEQADLSAAEVPAEKIRGWKSKVKQARADIVQLASSSPTQSGANVPSPFGKTALQVPKADLSGQQAQLNTAMQGVQIAQNAVDVAQNSYDAAVKKQAETAKAMAEVEKRLKGLQEKGKTLDEIKKVLKDCIAVLVDLVIQIGKIEKFFTMLTTVVDHIILPQAERFNRDLTKVGQRAARDKYINIDDVTKQTIYVSTLQLKAYFSLLEDIATMYMEVDKKYIFPGMELCGQLSAGSASKIPMDQLSQKLAKFSQDSVKAVADLVSQRQQDMLKGLRDRAKKAAENTHAIENTVREQGLEVDQSAKAAIEKGAEQAKQETKTLVESNKSATALENEEVDLLAT